LASGSRSRAMLARPDRARQLPVLAALASTLAHCRSYGPHFVTPAQAGVQPPTFPDSAPGYWIPAFAGMTFCALFCVFRVFRGSVFCALPRGLCARLLAALASTLAHCR